MSDYTSGPWKADKNLDCKSIMSDMYEVLKEIVSYLDVDEEERMTIGCHCTDTGTGAPLICAWCRAKEVLAMTEKNGLFQSGRPEIVCLCGSIRFIDTISKITTRLSQEGHIALPLIEYPATEEQHNELHRHKMNLSDWIMVVDEGGYIGDSTKNEIKYAQSLGKTICYWSQYKAQ